MPRKYQRSVNAPKRATWTEEQLIEAAQKVKDGIISKRGAHKQYGIPPRTLDRRMKSGNMIKGSLGPEGKYYLKINR